MKCKDCACYKDRWCTMVTDSPDPDMERDCGHFIKAHRWIPVTDQLPGVSGKYLCVTKDKRGNLWTIACDWSLEMKSWLGEFGEIKNIVAYWMPLPEPPEVID